MMVMNEDRLQAWHHGHNLQAKKSFCFLTPTGIHLLPLFLAKRLFRHIRRTDRQRGIGCRDKTFKSTENTAGS